MTIFKSVYDVEHDSLSVGIKKRNDVYNEGVLATYELKFDEVAIARMKTLRQRIEDARLLEGDDEDGEASGLICDAARSVADSVPEEIAYTLQGYADNSIEYHDVFADWVDRILEEIKD